MTIVGSDDPPLRLPLGEICLNGMRAKLGRVNDELDRWESVPVATSFQQSQG